MAAQAILISEQRVKQLTSLDQNVRVEDITPFIIQSQDLYLYPRLGFKFFERLKQGVIDNNLNADEQKLLNEYVGPMLANYAVYHMLPGLKYKFVDKGILITLSICAAAEYHDILSCLFIDFNRSNVVTMPLRFPLRSITGRTETFPSLIITLAFPISVSKLASIGGAMTSSAFIFLNSFEVVADLIISK